MCCLFKVKILEESDNVACCLKLFDKYLKLVRRLQKTYRMEPAGSQGVWSLDDYQFVPFIWGSAQLAMNTPFDPSKFLDEDVISNYKDDYLYIGCIHYICEVKTGMFAEHSNQLWSISAVPTWSNINSGLVKMYQKEVRFYICNIYKYAPWFIENLQTQCLILLLIFKKHFSL